MNIFNRIQARLWLLTTAGLKKGPHITRFAMDRHLEGVGRKLSNREGEVLSINHSTNFLEVLGLKAARLAEADPPDHDILSLQFPDESFDFVLADQVLEHVKGDLQQAMDETRRVLRAGGIAVHTTSLMMPVQGAPDDYWRITPHGLRLLARNFSEIIDCDGWGNLDVWKLERLGLRYSGIPLAGWHPLNKMATRNDPDFPVVTWLVARK